eukprot:TRINITY_DN5891_c0_g1_i2.p1 TRINITY_DN5891_c0_g1~~TRINITY_DN5891_c0_g1_i2.p1  ORF type:complete len:219 (+),score=30.69 TRINITY_DN5891_c0_g1_i2:1-657(+)
MAFFARLPGMAFFACEQDEREGALGMAPEVTVLVFIKVAQPSTPSRRDQFQRDDLVLKFKELARMRMVALAHPLWAELVQQEKIWSMLALRRWPNISPYINISDWRAFYARRHRKIRTPGDPGKPDMPSIENCGGSGGQPEPGADEWEFLCPVSTRLLERTPDKAVDFCNVCQKNVHLVGTEEELTTAVEAGHCVSYAPDVLRSRSRRNIKGKRKVRR